MSQNIFAVLSSGLLGAVLGVWFSSFLARRRSRVTLALDMHKEWNGVEMTRHRRIGYSLIKKHPRKDYNELVDIDDEGSISLFVVMRFFQRPYYAIHFKEVAEPLVNELFSEVFYDWYYQTFETGIIPLNWGISKNLSALATWLQESVSLQDRQEWKMKYRAKRAARLK